MDPAERLSLEAEHLLSVRRHDEALAKIGEALALRPDDPDLLVTAARIHLSAEDLDAALGAARKATAARPSAASLHIVSLVHRRRADWSDALAAVDAAIALRPESSVLHVTRSLVLAGQQLDDSTPPDPRAIADGFAAASHAGHLDATNAGADYAAAVCALAADDLPRAAACLDAALTKRPDWADAHRLLAHVRARQGMSKLASRHLAAAGRLDPADTRTIEQLRRLSRPARLTLGSATPMVLLIAMVIAAVSIPGAVAAAVVGMAAVAAAVAVFGRRTISPDTSRLVPEARRIIEADARLNGPLV